jgi:hypothetical protein
MASVQAEFSNNQAKFGDCEITRWSGGAACSGCGEKIRPGVRAHLIRGRLLRVFHPECCPTHPVAPVKVAAPVAEQTSFLDSELPGLDVLGPAETAEEIKRRRESEPGWKR